MGKSGKLLKTIAQGVRAFKSPSKDRSSKEQSPSQKTQKQGRELSRRGGKDKCLWSLGKSSSRHNRETVPSPSSPSLDAVDIKVVHEEQQKPTSDDAYHPTSSPIHDKPAIDIKVPGAIDVEGISSINSFAESSPEKDSTELAKECAQEEWAAAKIQAGLHHYQDDFRALKALIRIQALARGRIVRRQAAITLRCVQAVVRMQALVRGRRARRSEIGQIVQRHLQERREDAEGLGLSTKRPFPAMDEDEGGPSQTRQALAHAFSEQLRRCAPKQSSLVIDPATNENHWGWMWLERWMAARPWENLSNLSPSEGERPCMLHVARAIDENVQSQTKAIDIAQEPSSSGTIAKGAENTNSTVRKGTICAPLENLAYENPLPVEESLPAPVTEKGTIMENLPPPFPPPEGTSSVTTALQLKVSPPPPPPLPQPVALQPPLSAPLLPKSVKTATLPLPPPTAPPPPPPPPPPPAPMLSLEQQFSSPVGTLKALGKDNQAFDPFPLSPYLDGSQLETSAPPATTSLPSAVVPSEAGSQYGEGIPPPLQIPDQEAGNGCFGEESVPNMNGEVRTYPDYTLEGAVNETRTYPDHTLEEAVNETRAHPDHTVEEAMNGCCDEESMSSMDGENRTHPDHTMEEVANGGWGGEESSSSMAGENKTQAAEKIRGDGEETQLGKESRTKAPARSHVKANGKGGSPSTGNAASHKAAGAINARRLSSSAMAVKPQEQQQQQQQGEVCASSSPSVPNYMATTQSSKAKMRSIGAGGSPKQKPDSPKQKLVDSPSSSASKRRHSLPGSEGKGSPVAQHKHTVSHVRAGSKGHLASLRDGCTENSPRSNGESRLHGANK